MNRLLVLIFSSSSNLYLTPFPSKKRKPVHRQDPLLHPGVEPLDLPLERRRRVVSDHRGPEGDEERQEVLLRGVRPLAQTLLLFLFSLSLFSVLEQRLDVPAPEPLPHALREAPHVGESRRQLR